MENNRNYIVYCHIHPDGRRYVGLTGKNPLERWKNGYGYKHNTYFYNSIQKIGWDSFQHIILAKNLTRLEACKLETFFILKYKSYIRECGYNLTLGGELNIPNAETRLKIKLNHARCDGEYNSFWGKKHTEESKKLISQNHDYAAQSGIYNCNSRPVICFETVQLFANSVQLSEYFGRDRNNIATKCRNMSSYKGLHFMYYDDFMKQVAEDPYAVQTFLTNVYKISHKYRNKFLPRLASVFEYERVFRGMMENRAFSKAPCKSLLFLKNLPAKLKQLKDL